MPYWSDLNMNWIVIIDVTKDEDLLKLNQKSKKIYERQTSKSMKILYAFWEAFQWLWGTNMTRKTSQKGVAEGNGKSSYF